MWGMDSSLYSASSNSTHDEVNNLITLISGHVSSHPIEDFDLHVGNLLDNNGNLGLLNSYQVGSVYIHTPMNKYSLNRMNRLIISFNFLKQERIVDII